MPVVALRHGRLQVVRRPCRRLVLTKAYRVLKKRKAQHSQWNVWSRKLIEKFAAEDYIVLRQRWNGYIMLRKWLLHKQLEWHGVPHTLEQIMGCQVHPTVLMGCQVPRAAQAVQNVDNPAKAQPTQTAQAAQAVQNADIPAKAQPTQRRLR